MMGVTSEPLCEDFFFKLVGIFVVASLEWENVTGFTLPLYMGPKILYVVLHGYLRVYLSIP